MLILKCYSFRSIWTLVRLTYNIALTMSLLNSAEKSLTRRRVMSPNVLQYANEKRSKSTFNDVTIEVDNETIAANRMILSCCSRFFEGMFDVEMKEKYQHDPVQINGFDGKAVKTLIDFMYSGEVTIKNENVMDLLAASDYLQLDEVKQFCFEFLESILSSDNCFAVRSAADLYQDEHLQNQIDEYISKNFEATVQTYEFKSLDKDSLRSCIEKLKRNHVREESIFKGLILWSKVDEEARKNDFPELFEHLIKLDAMPLEVLEETVLKENLIAENNRCLKLLTKRLFQQSKGLDATKIISFGGRYVDGKFIEVCSSTAKLQKHYPDFPICLYCHSLLLIHNHIYCIGGCTEDGNGKEIAHNNVWRLNINKSTLEWKEVAPLKQKRYAMGGAVFRETLVVAGGCDGNDLSSVEFYQAAINEWRISSSLHQPRKDCALVASDQHLYAIGGWSNDKCLSNVERTGNLKEQFQQVQPMQMARQYLAAVNCNGTIYAIGGQSCKENNTTSNTVERYSADEDKWSYVSSMITERSAHAACVMKDKIYVVGGVDAFDNAVHTIECYNPITDSWSVVGKTDADLLHHSIITL